MAFPNSPTNGQTYTNKKFNSSKGAWESAINGDAVITGTLGIGTASSAAGLEIVKTGLGEIIRNTSSTGYASLRLYNDQNSNVRSLEIDYMGSAYSGGEQGLVSTTGAFPLNLGTSNTTRMTILENGNVGVGTTTPQKPLDVNLSSASGSYASIAGTLNVSGWNGIHFGYSESGNNFYRKSLIAFERLDNAARGSIHFLNNNQNGNDSATLADSRMTITSSGNVGIGTTSPGALLEIQGSGDNQLSVYRSANNVDYGVGILYTLQNSSNVKTTYAETSGYIIGNTAGTENGGLQLITKTSGTMTAKVWINSSGDVGIGTSSPGQKLEVNGNIALGSNNYIYLHGSSDANWRFGKNGTTHDIEMFGSGFGPRSFIIYGGSSANTNLFNVNLTSGVLSSTALTNSGQIGGDPTNARNHFVQYNAGTAGIVSGWLSAAFGDTSGDRVVIGQASGKAHISGHNGALTDWANLTICAGGGNVGIGVDGDATYKLKVAGSCANTTGVWANYSDIRLKKNIIDINSALDTISKLHPVEFEWIDQSNPGKKWGFIAQEVENVVPKWVKEDSDKMKMLELEGINVLLVKAIQELTKRIEILEAK